MAGSISYRIMLALFAFGATAAHAADYDIVIRGGRVIDPASGRDEIADVGIRGRTIVAISKSPLSGKRTLNAKGLVVAPGFIDLHAHGQNPKAQMLQMQDGVTTALDMEGGAFPIRNMYDALSGHSIINFGGTTDWSCARFKVIANLSCHGHWAINQPVDGTLAQQVAARNTPTTPEQEQRIVAMLHDEIANGALGYGLLLGYVPGAGHREIYEIFKAAGANHYPVFVHARKFPMGPAPDPSIGSYQEVIADAAATGASLQIVHLPSTFADDKTPVTLDMIKGARQHGVDVTTEAYPYTAWSSSLGAATFDPGWQQNGNVTYSDIELVATGERLTKESFDKLRAAHSNATVIGYAIPPAVVDLAIKDPDVMIISDGDSWVTGNEHPRGAGTFSRVLGHYVREKGLDLKLAIAKMTIMPARRLEAISDQMGRKGRLQVGADADITVFDPAKIKDMATYQKPMQPSVGIHYVLVNGVPTLVDGKIVPDVFPGEAVRSTKPL